MVLYEGNPSASSGTEVRERSRDRNVTVQRRDRQKKSNQQTMVDIMMLLDTNQMADIRAEFEKEEDGLALNNFVRVMLKYLSTETVNTQHLVASLCELFAQVDVNGDATMEWDEFYGYIHEQGMGSQDHGGGSMMKYQVHNAHAQLTRLYLPPPPLPHAHTLRPNRPPHHHLPTAHHPQ